MAMIPLLITVLFFLSLTANEQTHAPTHAPVPYCYFSTGCANAATCQCTLYLTYCSIDHTPEGQCVLTALGLVVTIGACFVAVVLLIVLACCMYCCCFKKCCKGSKQPTLITNHHYHNPFNPFTSPIESQNVL